MSSKPHRPLVQRPHEAGLADEQGGPHSAVRIDEAHDDRKPLLRLLTRGRRDSRADAAAQVLHHRAHAGTLLHLDLPRVVLRAHVTPFPSGPTFSSCFTGFAFDEVGRRLTSPPVVLAHHRPMRLAK